MNFVIMEKSNVRRAVEQAPAVKLMNTVNQAADSARKAADCNQIAVNQRNIAILLVFANLDALHMLIVHQTKFAELIINALKAVLDHHAETIPIVQLSIINTIVHARLASSQKRAKDAEQNKMLM